MLKNLFFKISILLILVFFILFFNWETKKLDPVKALSFAGIPKVESFEELKEYPTRNGQTITEVNGVLIANFEEYQIKDNYVLIDMMPNYLKQAFIAIEDSRFNSHRGFDYIGILRAITVNLKNKDYSEGGSTITQQLVKNMFLTHEKKLDRKVEELVLASYLEREFTKDQILEMYLNQIYFGPRIYGVGNASTSYFGTNVSQLSLAQAALLAGIPRNPKAYQPTKNFKAAIERQEVVLNRMVSMGFISEKEKEEALREKIVIIDNRR